MALGGAADALAPEVARRPVSSWSAPTSQRSSPRSGPRSPWFAARSCEPRRAAAGAGAKLLAAREAERECVEAGAAPTTVAIETAYETDEGVLRAVATGAVELEAGATERRPIGEEGRATPPPRPSE